jgi:glycosyltransferase involved in cell wall biosynthesis
MRQRVVVNWSLSSFFGWGIYGLNLALQWSNDPDIELMGSIPVAPEDISVNSIQRRALKPFLDLSKALQKSLPPFGTSRVPLECPMLSDIDIQPYCLDQWICGQPTIGVVFLTSTQPGAATLARARSVPFIAAGSDWNKRILNAHGLDNVVTVLQGVDTDLFHPAPATRWLGDRFCVFSGGKLEYRKGQDIVLAAFRVFARRHKEALLVTAWHSDWPELARTLDASGFVSPVQFDNENRIDVIGWAAANDIDKDQVLDLGAVPNREMPSILRQMDVAVFPNRCEGGTNLVAMEAMACGLPVILSRNTGHLDLIEDGENCYPLNCQKSLDGEGAGMEQVAGWGESSVEEVVENLERVFADRVDAQRRGMRAAASMAKLTWKQTAEQLKMLLLNQTIHSHK